MMIDTDGVSRNTLHCRTTGTSAIYKGRQLNSANSENKPRDEFFPRTMDNNLMSGMFISAGSAKQRSYALRDF